MSGDGGPSPADIISYIGIPLAVLGVVPIFYTSINSVVTAYNVRRHLKKNAIMHAATRSSMLSGIIEVEFPIFSLTVLDRDEPDYWSLNPHPSRLKGGSWSIFRWNQLVTGKRSYRMQYSSDIKEPQANVDFDELLSFLMDRGAVPDAKGFRLLNMAGLWTPANTSLLLSPDRTESVLRVTFPEDSDGVLSLALQWRPAWAVGHGDSLPPHWMLIRNHQTPATKTLASTDDDEQTASASKDKGSKVDERERTDSSSQELPAYSQISNCVRIHLAMKAGKPIIDAILDDAAAKASPRISHSRGISPPHLQSSPVSIWFPALCAALGSLAGYSLWAIRIPAKLENLSQHDALPCGVLVLTDVLNDEEVPSWETPRDPSADALAFHQSHMERMQAQNIERTMSPAQRQAAENARRQREMQDMMKRANAHKERQQIREREAIESARMSTEVAAQGVLRLLRIQHERQTGESAKEKDDSGDQEVVSDGPWADVETASQTILHMMIMEDKTAQAISSVLERWNAWQDRGGMNKDDYEFVTSENCKWFYYAIVLMALLKSECSKESSLAIDLQECVKTWKRVKLG